MYADALNGDSSGTTVTDSYGFPYTDRVTQPLANLYSDTTLTLTILADKAGVPGGAPAPIPEPSTWVTMGLGFAGLAFVGYRARRKTAVLA
jgi:PEP-CTERM motif